MVEMAVSKNDGFGFGAFAKTLFGSMFYFSRRSPEAGIDQHPVAVFFRLGYKIYVYKNHPQAGNARRYRLKGYRLGPGQRYRPMEPDAQGRLRSETSGLLLGVSPGGRGVNLFDAGTGERLLTGLPALRPLQRAQKTSFQTRPISFCARPRSLSQRK